MKMNLSLKKGIIGGFITVGLALVLIASVSNLTKSSPALAAEATNGVAETHTINVNGQGELSITPDVAYVTFALVTKAPTAKEAQSKNAEGFANVQKVLFDTYKLDKKDVQTSGFQVQPVYTYSNKEEPKITSYTTTQSIQATYRELTKIGVLLDDLSGAGINQINGIQFDTEKRQEYEIQAIDNAMNNAASKAKAIAKNAGKELKGVINVTQGGNTSTPPIIYNHQMMKMAETSASASPETSISPGELKITTSVSVQYEF
jgi:uncharacterized protein YggE